MRTELSILSMVLLTGCASAFQPFDTTDKVLLATSSAAIAVDWNQTLNGDIESNPILGETPSDNHVNWYFAGCLLGNAGFSYLLTPKLRKVWLASITIMEIYYVKHNINAGVKVSW